jgi:SAM-dependent methyltransferase
VNAGESWERWADWYEAQFAPVFEWVLDAVAPAPGMTVLDLATGLGHPAIAVARRVQPGGRVVAADVSADMLAAAERRVRAAGVDNVSLREMDMHDIRLPDASCDAVTFGFALMFSPDPARVMAEVKRVLRPGGRLGLLVWAGRERNPYFTTVFEPLAQVTGAATPDLFRLAQPGELERILRLAGFDDITVEPRPIVIDHESIDLHWQIFGDLAPPLRSAIATLPAPDLARLRAAVSDALVPYIDGGRVRLPATPLCASGRRP